MNKDYSETEAESSYKLQSDDKSADIAFKPFNSLLEYTPFKYRIDHVNRSIDENLRAPSDQSEFLYKAAKHLLEAGGKRLRPLLAILTCEATGGTIDDALPYAVAVEFIQTASLIHDDIIDESNLRRGVPTVHRKYGLRIAILAADLLIAHSIKIVSEHGRPDVIIHIGECGIQMVEGEATDILMDLGNADINNQEQYFKMIESKTVSFIREVAKLGGIVSEADDDVLEVLGKYGELIGYAFQIRDDIIDLIGSETGKVSYIDLLKKRYNYPFILALETTPIEKRKRIMDRISNGELNDAIRLIEDTDAINKANEVALKYVKQAKSLVASSDLKHKYHLMALADFVITRNY